MQKLTKSVYGDHGSYFTVHSKDDVPLVDKLPPKTYTVAYNEMTGQYYLKVTDNFTLPSKLYGDVANRTDRVFRSFEERHNATGVLLAGEKGSGKSLLAKNLSLHGQSKGVPTIIVNEPHCDDKFFSFIQSIDHSAVVILDEFEKVFDKEDQEKLLTLLDGVYPSKKLYVLTCNDTYKVNSHMKNRPSRIYYYYEYEGIDRSFVKDYCEDCLLDKSRVQEVCQFTNLYTCFNFDMLKSLVEEMNRYNESAVDSAKHLNVRAEYNNELDYTIQLQLNPLPPGKKGEKWDTTDNRSWTGKAISDCVELYIDITDKEDNYQRAEKVVFSPQDIVTVTAGFGEVVYKNSHGSLRLVEKSFAKFSQHQLSITV